MTTDCTHWKPTDSSPGSIYPPPKSTYRVTNSNLSIHLAALFTHHQHSFIHPSPSFTWPPHHSSAFVRRSPSALTTQLEHFRFLCFVDFGRVQEDSGKNYYPHWYLLHLLPTLLKSRISNPCLFSLHAHPAPSLSSRLQTSDHRALIGGLRGNSYHTAII